VDSCLAVSKHDTGGVDAARLLMEVGKLTPTKCALTPNIISLHAPRAANHPFNTESSVNLQENRRMKFYYLGLSHHTLSVSLHYLVATFKACKFTSESVSERRLKIGQHLA